MFSFKVLVNMISIILCVNFMTCLALSGKNKYVQQESEMYEYLRTESIWMDMITDMVKVKKGAFSHLQQKHREFSEKFQQMEGRSHYLANFPNAFSLAVRLTKTWPVIHSFMTTTFGDMIKTPNIFINTDKLWDTAVLGLVRIQQSNNISAETMASGLMEGTCLHANMSAATCFSVGLYYYKVRHAERATEWLQAALRRTDDNSKLLRLQIMEHLHLALCFKGDAKGSSTTMNALLEEYPTFSPSLALEEDYNFVANTSCRKLVKYADAILVKDFIGTHSVVMQKGLCQGRPYNTSAEKDLKCRLVHYHRPHLKIQPFKLEEINLEPPLLLFHNVIHDKEIEGVITKCHSMTKPAMRDYGDSYPDPNMDLQYNYWVFYDEKDVFLNSRISERAMSVANLNFHFCESTMVASYGLGAELKLHYDNGDIEEVFETCVRPDYASLMFYLNDVAEGGYTIFPNIDRVVAPVKGAALMWFNRYPDWDHMLEMYHSGCPVVRGSKWIINKWFHVLNQDFPKCVPGKEKSYKYYYL